MFTRKTIFYLALVLLMLLNIEGSNPTIENEYIHKKKLEKRNVEIFNYNLYCLKDYKHVCQYVEEQMKTINSLIESKESLSFLWDYFGSFNFDIIVDDSKYLNLDSEPEIPVLLLDSDFVPVNDELKDKFEVYPNHKKLLKNIYGNKDRKEVDFIIILSNLKNSPQYSNKFSLTYDYVIIKEILLGMNINHELDFLIDYIDESIKYLNLTSKEQINKYNNTLIGHTEFSSENSQYKRLVAVGDIHGDYEKLVNVLRHAKLIDEEMNWIGYDTILVQIGDLIDRGSDSKSIVELVIKLRKQAKNKGGEVNLLLGNHELYNLQGCNYYTFFSDIMRYGSLENRRKKFSLDDRIGRLLRKEMNMTMIINNMIFIHAGLRKEYAAYGIDYINKKTHEVLINTPYDIHCTDTNNELFKEKIISDTEEGPSWTRFYTMNEDEASVCHELSEVLKLTNTTNMIVGHTIQENGQITTRCDNKLIMIDIGLSKYINDTFGYLEILLDKNEIWAIYN